MSAIFVSLFIPFTVIFQAIVFQLYIEILRISELAEWNVKITFVVLYLDWEQ